MSDAPRPAEPSFAAHPFAATTGGPPPDPAKGPGPDGGDPPGEEGVAPPAGAAMFADFPLTDLDRKSRAVLGDKVVIKSLAQQAAFHRLPRYVSEYLIAKYVRPESWQADLDKIKGKIRDLLPDLEHRELLKEKLLSQGEVTLIDAVEARVDLRGGQRWARVPCLGDDRVRVPREVTEAAPGLLLGGLWGTAKLRYEPETDAAAPNELVAFTPFQVGPPDVAAFQAVRARFTTDEWLSLMLQSAGYAAAAFEDRRTRLLLIARMVPLVERNVNVIELGPRQTGKTFLLRNLSPRVFTISGGKTTPANLFVHLGSKQVGILGTRKVIVFDEIAHTSFAQENETISMLKDYMESGQFSRGSLSFAADASLVLAGNLDVEDGQPHSRYRHLLEPLPAELVDSAFLDRIHGFLPGWEMPKISPASIATGVGFVTDYFGEVLVRLRELSFADRVRDVPMHAGPTRRDQTAVERLSSGLIKLVYPDGNLSDEELTELVTFASEMRQRVHHQLTILAPGEFKPRVIGPRAILAHDAPDLLPDRPASVDDRLNREAIVGAVTGLAVHLDDGREVGGSVMVIQVSCFNGTPKVEVTGLHGRTLRDSVRAVYNLIRAHARTLDVTEPRLLSQTVAVHLVEIATPREGPSAGLAFLLGMVSALTGRAVRPGFACTGEVSLHGDVGGVGGVAHKLAAAVRAGRTTVVLPRENERDVAAVDPAVRAKLTIHLVGHASEAIDLALEP